MNQFVLLFRTSDSARRAALGTPEQAQKSMEAWLTWIKRLEKSGLL